MKICSLRRNCFEVTDHIDLVVEHIDLVEHSDSAERIDSAEHIGWVDHIDWDSEVDCNPAFDSSLDSSGRSFAPCYDSDLCFDTDWDHNSGGALNTHLYWVEERCPFQVLGIMALG